MREKSGSRDGRRPRVSDDDLADALREILLDDDHEAPVATAREISERVPIGLRATQARLATLIEDGETAIRAYDTGHSLVYWLDDVDDLDNGTDDENGDTEKNTHRSEKRVFRLGQT
ncbi:hypothetical protein [Halalkalicoccus salilacus]|uniref:hypothetical protein n=1 Tax=Halalkalicoccus salilacus TaxID=3117459 RepID=UPI00300E86A1